MAKLAINGGKYWSCLWDLDQEVCGMLKHNEPNKDQEAVLEFVGEAKPADKQEEGYRLQHEIRNARLRGYEGDMCSECGSFTMVRNGTCLKCDTCGATSGCS